MPGFRYAFHKYVDGRINSLGVSYDYDSVMHYDSRAFSMNGRTTIARKNGDTRLGNTRGLSTKVIQQAQLLYCKTKPTDDPPTLKPTTQSPEGNNGCLILVTRDRDRCWPKGSWPRLRGRVYTVSFTSRTIWILNFYALARDCQGKRANPKIGLLTKAITLKLFLDIVPSSSRILLARCVDVFVEDLFVVSLQSKGKVRTLWRCLLQYHDYEQGSFGSRYALIHFETLIGV